MRRLSASRPVRPGNPGRTPRRARVGIEPLEQRLVLATGDLAMTAATALNPSVVVAHYAIHDSALTAGVPLDIYRSADNTFDPSDTLLGQTMLTGSQLDLGSHSVDVTLTSPLIINPSQKYVIAVANQSGVVPESNPNNNTATFRIWVVGAVTSGYEPTGQLPAWVTQMTTSLNADGYDAAIPFDWAALSALPKPGMTTLAAQGLSAQIGQTVNALPGRQPTDVVDVHLIGFSRGGSVVAQTAGILPTNVPPLQGGFLKLTLLDPHPARNEAVPYVSVSSGPIGQLALKPFLRFQALANDPALLIPANVQQTEVFSQHAKVQNAAGLDEKFLNSWGVVPVGGASASAVYYNLTQVAPGHTSTYKFYQQAVVPNLATTGDVPLPPSPAPAPPTDGGAAFPPAIGLRYEDQIARAIGVPSPVALHLLRGIRQLNTSIDQGRTHRATAQLVNLSRFVVNQRGRSIPNEAADYLLLTFALTGLLVLPPHTS